MGFKIESSIIDGNIEKKSLYENEDEYDQEENGDREEIRSAMDSLESLETDSYSALGNVGEIETLFDANDLGRATINVPTTQKQTAQAVEPQLSPEQIAEIGDDANKIAQEFKKRSNAMRDELSDFF